MVGTARASRTGRGRGEVPCMTRPFSSSVFRYTMFPNGSRTIDRFGTKTAKKEREENAENATKAVRLAAMVYGIY